MKDTREPLSIGTTITLGGTEYTIVDVLGKGSNAVCYRAEYADNTLREKKHSVIIKELFPLHNEISRTSDKNIFVAENGAAFFDLHKSTFLRASEVNADLNTIRPDKSMTGINTFEYGGTFYSVISVSGGTELSDIRPRGLKYAVEHIAAVIHALRPFHEAGLLHLDIAPDNILIFPRDKGETYIRALLIDYNSAYLKSEIDGKESFSIKKPFTAPEIILRDIHSIGCAADLFSVVALFAKMLFDKFDGNVRDVSPDLPIFEGIPTTAVYKAINIVVRGLRNSARQRFQSIDELLSEFTELSNRIECKGVTKAALWEASAAYFRAEVVACGKYQHILDDELPSPLSLHHKHTMITGTGGLGKTTALLRLLANGVSRYNPALPIPIYIKLNEYSDNVSIRMRCLDRLRFNKTITSVSDALKSLDDVFLEDNAVILLLDGLNEVPLKYRESLLSEIGDLQRREGLQIVLTSRTDNKALHTWACVELQPLNDKSIREYLGRRGLLYPENDAMRILLSNPMMLSMYANVTIAGGKNSAVYDETDLINAYFDYAAQKANDRDTAIFAMRFLLPQIAFAIKKRGDFTIKSDALSEITSACFDYVKTKRFTKLFPEYIGQTAGIISGAESADPWFAIIINHILCNELSLLVRSEDDGYAFFHEIFLDYCEAAGEDIRKKTSKLTDRRPYAFVVLAILLAACGILFAVYKTPYPNTQEEINAAKQITDQASFAVYFVGIEADNMRESISDLIGGYDFEKARSRALERLEFADTLKISETVASEMLSLAYKPRSTFAQDSLEWLFAASAEFHTQNTGILTNVLENWDRRTETANSEILSLYSEWLDNYLLLVVVETNHALAKLPPEYRERVFVKTHSPSIAEKVKIAQIDDTNYTVIVSALKETNDDIINQLYAKGVLIE